MKTKEQTIKDTYVKEEFEKRDKELVLIASENYPSQDVLDASGSIMQLKYAEGFPYKRYYQGCSVIDKMEQECIDTVLKLFNAEEEYLANVQPNSGASANMIVYNAVLRPNDTVLAPDVKSGGHISHSHPKSFIAKYHNVVTYGVTDEGLLDYNEIEKLAIENKPKLIICGASNYPRVIDFKRFKEIADKVGALLMADIAHISLICAHGFHPSPVGLADFITFTTHKMLKGPRGAVILYKKDFDRSIRTSTIPGLFGGPLEHQIYAKLICFREALTKKAKEYAWQIMRNAMMMSAVFQARNVPMVTGKTENHLMTVDLRDYFCSGRELAIELEECGIICNCNTVPNDPRSFMETSGIRLGVPAITARGLDEFDVQDLATALADFINTYSPAPEMKYSRVFYKNNLKAVVSNLTKKYPLKRIYREVK